jgi:hypothetical protein
MIETQETFDLASGQLGVLSRDFQARLLNYSPSGCLLETNMRLEVGTIGTLRFLIDGREMGDDVQIVRCQPIEGAGALYQVGARFLWTIALGKDTLRLALDASNSWQQVRVPESQVV